MAAASSAVVIVGVVHVAFKAVCRLCPVMLQSLTKVPGRRGVVNIPQDLALHLLGFSFAAVPWAAQLYCDMACVQ